MIESLHRTLEQELAALSRGASLECLVCGEFVMHVHGGQFCPECGTAVADDEIAAKRVQLAAQAG